MTTHSSLRDHPLTASRDDWRTASRATLRSFAAAWSKESIVVVTRLTFVWCRRLSYSSGGRLGAKLSSVRSRTSANRTGTHNVLARTVSCNISRIELVNFVS